MIFLQLFLIFSKIGIVGFGGGYAMLSLIQDDVVTKEAWLSAAEFTDIVAVSQMTPGPLGINMATYVGYTSVLNAGYPPAIACLGSLLATISILWLPFIVMMLVSRFLLKHKESPLLKSVFGALRPTVVGLVAAAAMVAYPTTSAPIGVFDSGYGGLTILSEICRQLPQYDYIYLGDNARSPYGTRSFDVINDFTLQAVKYLFDAGCPLVILACNTASAKALREIQQHYLPYSEDPTRRVLGVIRPTVEAISRFTKSRHIGVVATPGTVSSHSYATEIGKLFPEVTVEEQACPMWVPLVEYGESNAPGADYFVEKYTSELMQRDPKIDTIILGCTHYPLLRPKIREALPESVELISQGELVASSLADYLLRHPEMEHRLSQGGEISYRTTECPEKFEELASIFTGTEVRATRVKITG